jgi:lysine 2,3-aminomutase
MEGLRGHLSGLGIPTYVVDSPHGGGKIPLMPNYLISASDDAVVLRNFEGLLVRYQAEDKPNTIQPTRTRGVSSLLQGSQTALIPQDSERMQRRRLHDLTNHHLEHPELHDALTPANDHAPTNGHANGCCGSSNGHSHNGHARNGLYSLDVLANGYGS